MNNAVMKHLQRKLRDNRDSGDMRRNSDMMDYERRDYEDERRGVRGTGRTSRRDYEDSGNDYAHDYRDSGDSRDSRDYRDYRDSRDYRDYNDSHEKLKLSKTDMMEWKRNMENADGTRGAHYDMQQIMQAAEKAGIRFDDFSEKDFCMAVNYIYSDYCKTIKKYVPTEKELAVCLDLARDFLEDVDGPEPSEKLALYFHCIVN